MAVDELGRPVVWHDGHSSFRGTEADGEKEERRRRVESYLKNSNMSLVRTDGCRCWYLTSLTSYKS